MPLWWLSFCDATRPKGEQFLGAAIVRAEDIAGAIRAAWRFGCNPGGEVLSEPFPEDLEDAVPDHFRHRLLSRAECAEVDELLKR